jgi:hypothetical protein
VLPEAAEQGECHHRYGNRILRVDPHRAQIQGAWDAEGELVLDRDRDKAGREDDIRKGT